MALSLDDKIQLCVEKKQYQEYFVSKVETVPSIEIFGNIYFGSELLNVHVDHLSDETKNTIKQLILKEMKESLKNITDVIEHLQK